jgi:hypothetical protein
MVANPPEPAPSPEPAPDDGARWIALLAALRAEPTRERVLAIRAELRSRISAGENETLGDLAARGACGASPAVLQGLRGVERAAFVDDPDVTAAVREALPALEAIVGP